MLRPVLQGVPHAFFHGAAFEVVEDGGNDGDSIGFQGGFQMGHVGSVFFKFKLKGHFIVFIVFIAVVC